jgi:predicted site-specific integrase-resolvase
MKSKTAEPRAGVLSDWIGRAELAEELGVTPDTLARWATRGTGPPLVKVGRRVFYRRRSVERWLAESERRNGNG